MLQKFRTYQLAKDFYRDIENLEIKAHFKEQLVSAALSIINNLAEGSAKISVKERARFYEMAFASFRECQAILDISGYTDLISKYDQLGAHLFRLRKHILSPKLPHERADTAK